MKRRIFIGQSVLGALSLQLNLKMSEGKTHILTLSFDDGFIKSFRRIAEMHKEYGFKACLNVIATGHLPGFNTEPKWIPQKLLGNFHDWNRFVAGGHEVMLHTWDHLNLTKIPEDEAKKNLDRCLDYFEKNLDGYSAKEAVYNFAYNDSTPALEDHLLQRIRAVRTGGWLVLKDQMINLIPRGTVPVKVGCWSHGPDSCDEYTEQEINKFLAGPGGWLVLNLHGLDEEGWGPVSTNYLDGLLKRLAGISYLRFMPTASVLKELAV